MPRGLIDSVVRFVAGSSRRCKGAFGGIRRLGTVDSFTESEHTRSADYNQRVQKAGRIAAFSQLAIAGYAVLFTSHRFDHDAWLPTLVITIGVLCIVTSIPAVANGAWRALILDRSFGLSVAKAGGWWLRTARLNGLAIALSLITGVSLFAVIRYGEPWWPLAWVVLATSVAIRFALAPIFVRLGNRTRNMPPELVHIMDKVSVDMGVRPPRTRVLSNDSRVVPNAMVSGLGPFRTLYLTEPVLSIPSAEFEAVLAHELAHVRHHDIEKTVGMLAVLQIAAVVAMRVYVINGSTTPHSLNASSYASVFLTLLILNTYISMAVLAGRRRQEARADRDALDATRDPVAFRDLMRRLATANLLQLDGRGLASLGCSHPSPAKRIALVDEWEKKAGIPASGP